MNKDSFLHKAFDLYYDGFRSMRLGKTLWAIILIKLVIIFAILKVFFFPDFLKEHAQGTLNFRYYVQQPIIRH